MKYFLLIHCAFSIIYSYAQTPSVLQWQKCYGGSFSENGNDIDITSDGGYVLIGSTNSNNLDVVGNHGGTDVWVVKTNFSGQIEWQKCLGGTGTDSGIGIEQLTDGGYILVGTTNSISGDVSGNHGSKDIWVVKLNSIGDLLWQKCLGGVAEEEAKSIKQTNDGGFIVSGNSLSNNGDVSGNHGGTDIWMVKLNSVGNLQWQKCFGGGLFEEPEEVNQTTDGGYILVGSTNSIDGDISGNNGGYDVCVIKTNSTGIIEWQKCLGGSLADGGSSIDKTLDGGYILSGAVTSNDLDVSGNHGGSDSWVVKLNSVGNLLWQKCLGGSNGENGLCVKSTLDGGYILTSYAESNDGDIIGNHGLSDNWITKLNSSGIIEWQKTYGGSSDDYGEKILQSSDGYIFAGLTNSNDGDVSGNHGNNDVWLVKIIECNGTTNSSSVLNVSSCTSYTTPLGQVLSNSCTITETIQNYLGCDSLITINFTKYDSETYDSLIYVCDLPYSWNGQSCTTFGTYSQILQTVNGCDSTLNLTISSFPVQDVCLVGNDFTTGKNKVVWEKEQTQFIDFYNIYRENSQTGSFDLIGTNDYSDSSWFLDLNSNPNQQAYRYHIKYVDTCGTESLAGTTHKTIHLTINQGVGTDWNLIWTPYEGISYASYNIYRGTNSTNMSLLTTLPSNLTTFTDITAPVGNIYYQIEIVSPTVCNPTKSPYNNSRSNISSNDPSYLEVDHMGINSILIFPNPTNNHLNIEYDGQIQKLEIVDLKGAKVYSSIEKKKVYALPTNIQTGFYMLLIYTNEGLFRKELLIEK